MNNNHPLVSYILLVYKQEKFIKEALISALAQTYEPLEIIISDDCSPDNSFDVIKKLIDEYSGPHTIKLNRNPYNLGIAENINRCFELASGQFFIMAAGDDISVPERTDILVKRWRDKENPVDLVCSYFEEIDVNSNSTGFIKKNVLFTPDINLPVYKWSCGATGACASYSRKLYDKYGPIDSRIIAEDWVLSFRAWMESGLALIEKPLVRHRTHDSSLSKIHQNINSINNSETRRLLRQKNLGGQLAMAKEWQHACERNDKYLHDAKVNELKKWISLLETELLAYQSSRKDAFKHAISALYHNRNILSAIKILVRNVFRIS